ncbi:hypothetical protein PVK73_28835 [Bacillus thuringiensis]
MATGWKKIDNKWYYFNNDGLQVKGTLKQIDGKWYYFKTDGTLNQEGILQFKIKDSSLEGYFQCDDNGAITFTSGLKGGFNSLKDLADKIIIKN